MPLQKVDTEKRLVTGFATLDNADTQGDIVEAEASQKAFARFRGNIREMHQPIAVGKMIDFKEDTYYDTNTEKFYSGIVATAYVSKGAQATWEKVLDGTLTGFSIGGNILDSTNEFDKAAGKSVRFVKDYELVELSLVDSPANQLANVFSVQKSIDGVTSVSGYVSEMNVVSIFWCPEDGLAKESSETTPICPVCSHDMEPIGWFELDDDDSNGPDDMDDMDPMEPRNNVSKRAQKIAAIVHQKLNPVTKGLDSETNEGGVNVAEENKDAVADEVVVSEEVVLEESGSDESVVAADETEKAANVSEVEVPEPDFEKMLAKVLEDVSESISKGNIGVIDEVTAKFAPMFEDIITKVSELSARHGELSEKFNGLNNQLESVEKRVDSVVGETAVKKSSDLGGSKEDSLEKSKDSKWGGFFSADFI